MEKQLRLNDVLEHLSHKERYVSDLISFLRNMCDKTPNYTLLLGAGCSVTSGINSGADLIKQWKEEIYKDSKSKESEEDFWRNQYKWFDERNPYSSLFQKKYDLPRQRRIFVERQVSNKIPSIGYAYLIKLIEKNFFNTVFTTNFDDLLNEAFYRYSGERPIVCAHDSSISSITLTSIRPKIIKLHGDYLFDDIKSTLRETESLNDNMKEKFIEFSKDHGLIVVGYAGHDRSIMDILSMLLQKEDYFKHGIYWCVRDGDEEISDELHHLLWKDRVYYVRIKGFDELMAVLNDQLNEGELPIDGDLLSSSRQKRLIRDLTDNKYISKETNNHDIIKRDINRLSKIVNKNIINDFWDIYSKQNLMNNDDPRRKLQLRQFTEKEQSVVEEIRQYIENDEKEKALKAIDEADVDEKSKSKFAYTILNLKKDLLTENDPNKQGQIKELCDKIIELAPSREKSYIEAFNVTTEKNVKTTYLDKAIQQFPQDIFLYNQKARYLLDYCYDDLNSDESKKELLDVVSESVEKSLQIKDLPTNMAWLLKCRYIEKKFEYDFDGKKEGISNVFTRYSCVKTPYLAEVYETYYSLLGLSEKSCEEKLKELYKAGIEADDNSFVEMTVMSLLRFYSKNKKTNEFDIIVEEYERSFIPSEDYEYAKVSALAFNLGRYKEAEEQLLKREKKSSRWQTLAFKYYCDTRQENHAHRILEAYFPDDEVKRIKFYSSMNHDEEVIKLLDKYWENNPKTVEHISYYTCSLLRLKRYDEAYTITKKYYDDPQYKEGSIYVNFFIAEHEKFKKDNKDRIKKKIIDDKKSFPDIVLAAAYALVGDRTNMYPSLRSAIKKDDLYRFIIGDWPVFANYLNDDKFKELLKTAI